LQGVKASDKTERLAVEVKLRAVTPNDCPAVGGRAVVGGDEPRLPVSELSRASVSEILTQRGLEGNLIHELTSVIDEAEFARFAPVREGDMQQLYDRAAQIIGQIDSHKLRK